MRPSRLVIGILLIPVVVLVAWGAWLTASGDWAYEPLLVDPVDPVPDAPGYPWKGAFHVHTDLSADASGSLEEIAAAASRAGLDYVVVADHTRALGSRGRHEPGWRDGVLVVVGEEISTTAGHLVALDLATHNYTLGPTPRQAFADVSELGGVSVLAHPSGGEASWQGGWGAAAGVEVVSFYSALIRASEAGLLRGLLAYPVNPMAASARVLRAPSPTLEIWDRHTALEDNPVPRRLAGVGAVDAHGPRWLGMPSYEVAFRSLHTVVWSEDPPSPDPAAARVQMNRLVDGLVQGRAAIVQAAVGEAPGFFFVAERRNGTLAHMGETPRWRADGWTLRAGLGAAGPYSVVLLRDGRPVARADGGPVVHTADGPGTYRVEVYRHQEGAELPPGAPPWILSNPIYLWPPEAVVASQLHVVPPLPLPELDASLLVRPGWSADSDAGAHSAVAAADTGLLWDLRLPREEPEGAFSALSWRPESAEDWSGRSGLGVELRSDSPWRVSLVVWTRGEAGDEHTWERVVSSGPEGSATPAMWADFRRVDPGAPEVGAAGGLPAELGGVTGVALLVTPERIRAGAQAQIHVMRLGSF